MDTNVKPVENECKHWKLTNSMKLALRQSIPLSSGYLLMFVSGLNIGWGIFNPEVNTAMWAWSLSEIFKFSVISSYYYGVFLGIVANQFWLKPGTKNRYQIAAAVSAVSGMLFIAMPDLYAMVIVARVLAGFSAAISFLTWIVQCEILTNSHSRGILLSLSNTVIFAGVYTALIVILVEYEIFNDLTGGKLRSIGIIIFVASFTVFRGTIKLIRESPAYLIRQENYDTAVARLLELRNVPVVTSDISAEFDELKLMVQEDDKLGSSILGDGNIKPLIVMCVVATVSTVSFNYPVNMKRFRTIGDLEHRLIIFIGIFIVFRIILSLIACNLCNIVGRKKIQLISGFINGMLLFILAFILMLKYPLSQTVFVTLFIVQEFYLTVGVNSIMAVLMLEAFPLSKREGSVSIILTLESFLQVLLIGTTNSTYTKQSTSELLLLNIGCIILGLTVFLLFRLPETMGLTMRQAREAFKKSWK